MHENLIIYLIGPPGVGKATVGRLLAEQLPAKLVDNHYWLNPIFGLIEQDGVTPLPDRVWDLASRSRRVVMATISELSPASWSFIFTHAAVGSGVPLDQDIASDINGVATARNAELWVVQLVANAEELERRVVSPERRRHMKSADPNAARINAAEPPFDPGMPNTMRVDTTQKSPAETAQEILSNVQQGGRNLPPPSTLANEPA